MDRPDSDGSFTAPAAPRWQQWLLFAFMWGGILAFVGTRNVWIHLGVTGKVQGEVLALVAILHLVVLVGMFVVPSALTAALLRGRWLRFGRRIPRHLVAT